MSPMSDAVHAIVVSELVDKYRITEGRKICFFSQIFAEFSGM